MNKNQDPQKWGLWDITDEQAEKINNGDIDEYNAFFMRNYKTIENLCYSKLIKLSNKYQSDVDVCDIINAFYFDLYQTKFESGALLSHLLYLSAVTADRSSYNIARKISPDNLNYSFKTDVYFQSMQYENSSDHGEEFFVVDLYETAPSPQEEIDLEESEKNIKKLSQSLKVFLSDDEQKYIDFYLNGIRPAHAEQRLGKSNGFCYYQKIKNKLIIHYQDVLDIFSNLGYFIPSFLKNTIPDNYDELMRPILERKAKKAERERKRVEAQAEKERKAQERAERAKTAKERNKAYYVMRRYGETLEEHEARLKAEAEEKQRQKELAQLEKERKAQERAERHLQSLEKRRQFRKEYYANKRANETPEQREKRLESMRQYARQRYTDGKGGADNREFLTG